MAPVIPILTTHPSCMNQWCGPVVINTGPTLSSQCREYNLIEHPCNAVVTSQKILVECRKLWLNRRGRTTLIMNSKLCSYINRESFTTIPPVVSELPNIPLSIPDPPNYPMDVKGHPRFKGPAPNDFGFEPLSDVVSVLRQKHTVESDSDAPQCVYFSSIIIYDKANIPMP